MVSYYWSFPLINPFLFFWAHPSGSALWFPLVLIDIPGFPATVNCNTIVTAITNCFLFLEVVAVQFVGNVARVSFRDAAVDYA